MLFKYPIVIGVDHGVDLCNFCKGKTKRLGLHVEVKVLVWAGRKRNGYPQHMVLHALQERSGATERENWEDIGKSEDLGLLGTCLRQLPAAAKIEYLQQ